MRRNTLPTTGSTARNTAEDSDRGLFASLRRHFAELFLGDGFAEWDQVVDNLVELHYRDSLRLAPQSLAQTGLR